MLIVSRIRNLLPAVLGVQALELRLVPFDVVAPIRTRNDEEWIVDATFALQLFSGQVLAATASPFRLDGGREDRFEVGRLLASQLTTTP